METLSSKPCPTTCVQFAHFSTTQVHLSETMELKFRIPLWRGGPALLLARTKVTKPKCMHQLVALLQEKWQPHPHPQRAKESGHPVVAPAFQSALQVTVAMAALAVPVVLVLRLMS